MENKNELVIERVFDAPVALVWNMWTTPEGYKKWWGPKDFTAPVVTIDFQVGGKFLGCMEAAVDQGPLKKGQRFWSTGTYKEIVPMQKIVVTDSFADENGNIISSEEYGMTGFPREMLVTVTFEDLGGKTKMTLRHEGIKDITDEDRRNMEQGWKQSFDKMDAGLKTAS